MESERQFNPAESEIHEDNAEKQGNSLTSEQTEEVSELLGIEGKNEEELEQMIDEKADEFLNSEQVKKIEEKKPGFISKLSQSKFLKIALLTGSLLMAEVATSEDTFGQEKQERIEKQETEKYDFSKFTEAWKEWKADKEKDKRSWSDSDWDKFVVRDSKVKEEMEKMCKFIAQDEKYKESVSYQNFLKQYPEGFSHDMNKYLEGALSGDEFFKGMPYETEISEKDYSIIYKKTENITQQEGGRFYSVPESRDYQIKLNIDGQDVFIGNWNCQPQGRTPQ